jgi:predicted SAM-dependent methyltransferase
VNKLPYLNLGCGNIFDGRWTNVDFVCTGEGVIAYNLREGIPFGDCEFEVVFHSHLLEHLPRENALCFLQECWRVLKPRGLIRVAVPDLEQIALNYICYLKESLEGKPGAKAKYEWSTLELFDQMVRNTGGGEMMKYMADQSKNNDEFLVQRLGPETIRMFEAARNGARRRVPRPPQSLIKRIKNRVKRDGLMRLLGGEYQLLEQARFRNGGEIHQWMYDRLSLADVLVSSGFRNPRVRTAFESDIPGWSEFRLDGEGNCVRKPDSLFMEAVK